MPWNPWRDDKKSALKGKHSDWCIGWSTGWSVTDTIEIVSIWYIKQFAGIPGSHVLVELKRRIQEWNLLSTPPIQTAWPGETVWQWSSGENWDGIGSQWELPHYPVNRTGRPKNTNLFAKFLYSKHEFPSIWILIKRAKAKMLPNWVIGRINQKVWCLIVFRFESFGPFGS